MLTYLQSTDPQFVFGPGSPNEGTWIVLTFQPIGPFGFQLILASLAQEQYEDQEWVEFGEPFGALQTNVAVPTDPSQRVDLMLSMQDSPGEIMTLVAAQYPGAEQPPGNWIEPYTSQPVPFNPVTNFNDLAALFNVMVKTQKSVTALCTATYPVLMEMNDDQLAVVQNNNWRDGQGNPQFVGQPRAVFMANLAAFNNAYIATLPPG